jgi:hypothetical protein
VDSPETSPRDIERSSSSISDRHSMLDSSSVSSYGGPSKSKKALSKSIILYAGSGSSGGTKDNNPFIVKIKQSKVPDKANNAVEKENITHGRVSAPLY